MKKITTSFVLLGILCVGGISTIAAKTTNETLVPSNTLAGYRVLEEQNQSQILLEESTGYVWMYTTDDDASSLSIMVNNRGTAMTLEDFAKKRL